MESNVDIFKFELTRRDGTKVSIEESLYDHNVFDVVNIFKSFLRAVTYSEVTIKDVFGDEDE